MNEILNYIHAFPKHQDVESLEELVDQYPTLCGEQFLSEWTQTFQVLAIKQRDNLPDRFVESCKEAKHADETAEEAHDEVPSLFVRLVVFVS
jgi:hypothetical protein